jgi:uncharacterized protein YkwD
VDYAADTQRSWEALFDSPSHRANILNPTFRCVGVGVYRASGYGEMVTQDLSDCAGR